MAKAGTAKYSISKSEYNKQPAYQSTLIFRTTSGFDKIFKIRDTLQSYMNMDLQPIYHEKYLHEGSTHYLEKLSFKEFGSTKTVATSKRFAQDGSLRFEETLEASGLAFDMVGMFMFARTLDYSSLTPGTTFSVSSFIGKDVVKMKARYVGQMILEKSSNKKYKTLKFEMDIIDDAFATDKTALEVWISDDQNRIPIKLKAKLKIGAAEAELDSYKGNKYPLSSLVVVNSKN